MSDFAASGQPGLLVAGVNVRLKLIVILCGRAFPVAGSISGRGEIGPIGKFVSRSTLRKNEGET